MENPKYIFVVGGVRASLMQMSDYSWFAVVRTW